jgi:hypothetical protein
MVDVLEDVVGLSVEGIRSVCGEDFVRVALFELCTER